MDAELRKRWVAALRSGEYTQGREQLHIPDDGYCCLGVLCDIIDPAGWTGSEWHIPTQYREGGFSLEDDWLLEADLGGNPQAFGLSEGIQRDLVRMNDGVGVDAVGFTEIADWIEAHVG